MILHGIVAEFNPFHKGHEYMVKECRSNGATHIAAVMSGNFVQRGEAAVLSKWARTRAALMGGVDLVVELPVSYAISSAQRFARGAVSILDAMGCVDYLSFGSEIGDINMLNSVAEIMLSEEFEEKAREHLEKRVSYPTALQNTLSDLAEEEVAGVLSGANNTLAIEYIKALKQLDSSIRPFTINRRGAGHNSEKTKDGFMSATKIREEIKKGNLDCLDFVPKATAEIFNEQTALSRAPVLYERLELIILAKLRMLSIDDIKKAPDVSEGIEYRILDAVKKSVTLEELYAAIKTKRYTHARIRRIILALFLSISAADNEQPPPYIKVLGFTDRGQEILKTAKGTAKLPIIMKASNIYDLDAFAKHTFKIESMTTDIYTLAMPKPLPCGIEMTENIVIL